MSQSSPQLSGEVIRLFYDLTTNEPFVSSSFPTSNTNIGLSLRFTIAQ